MTLLALFLLLQNLTVKDILALPQPPADHRAAYGPAPEQFGELRLPKAPLNRGPHPVVIIIHGGCWMAQYDLGHIRSFSAALADAGAAVWTLEYRRVGNAGGGWPGTFDDIANGAAHLNKLSREHILDLRRVVVAGHSAGGHLALWLAAERKLPLRGVISLAGVTDLRKAAEQRVCGDVVQQLIGGTPGQVEERYRRASPAERLPLRVPVRLIQGARDKIVPLGMVREYEAAAKKAGDDARLIVVDDAAHFELIAPGTEAFRTVKQEIFSMLK